MQVQYIAENLNKKILQLYGKYLSEDGKTVDYDNMRKCDEWKVYCEGTAELKKIELKQLNEIDRKTFFMNIYNALTIHSTINFGTIISIKERGICSYQIGQNVFSLNEIEHGILRGNKKPPYGFSPFFTKNDDRLQYTLPLDPRIHFAISCGAKSCPPIRFYNSGNLNKALDLATQVFIRENVDINIDKKQIKLSKLFSWYHSDFGQDTAAVINWLIPYASDEQVIFLRKLLQDDNFTVSYSKYNWEANAK